MANSLLDFVMSVVRDPGSAAAYAVNPAQAIADANLTDVTSVDVNNLIPVVAESLSALSSSVPSTGFDTLGDAAHNVWASGAATAAFDAFDDHLPAQTGDVFADHVSSVANVIDLREDSTPTIVDHVIDDGTAPTIALPADPAVVMEAPTFDDVHGLDSASVDDAIDAGHRTLDDHLDHVDHPQDPGFDIVT
jgi:hypothetical protein